MAAARRCSPDQTFYAGVVLTLLVGLITNPIVFAAGPTEDIAMPNVSPSTEPTVPMTIPAWQVLRMAMVPQGSSKIIFEPAAYVAEIDALPQPIRRLRLLVELMATTGYTYDTTDDGLHGFFSNYHGALAPHILAALSEAGFDDRAKVLAEAMAAFGASYPVDNAKRGSFFAFNFMGMMNGIFPDPAAQPTAVDIKLKALGAAFGTNANLKREIEAYVAKIPELVAFTAQARANLGNEDRLSYLLSQLFSKLDGFAQPGAIQRQLNALPAPHRTVVLLSIFSGEIVNGGMEQFFSNSSGAYAPNVAAELRALGQTAAADAVARGMALFPAPYPIETNARRLMNDDARNVQLDALTVVVDVGAIHQAVVAFAARADWLPR